MAARYQSRATGAISNLKADGYLDGPNAGEAVWLELDLGTPATAQHAAEQFLNRETRLDVLMYYALKMSGQLLTPAQGAYTTLFAATSPKISDDADWRRYAGAYLTPFAVITEPLKEANDPVAARDMWETTERVISQM
ncbi:hypothetical protein FRB98_005382 [Tulasnella sp. 332]|nr:hypothetical protein FRB98_005382 [Tulasnella sp. 332]